MHGTWQKLIQSLHSTYRTLYWWPHSTSWRREHKWRKSGDLQQWSVGDYIWWELGQSWCYCCLQAIWIISSLLKYVLCAHCCHNYCWNYPQIGVEVFYSYFGAGTGPILYTNLHCDGTESRLDDCRASSSFYFGASHYSDAGVRCQRPATTSKHDISAL